MRSIIVAVCVFAAACSGQDLDSPTSPSATSVAPAQVHAQSGTIDVATATSSQAGSFDGYINLNK